MPTGVAAHHSWLVRLAAGAPIRMAFSRTQLPAIAFGTLSRRPAATAAVVPSEVRRADSRELTDVHGDWRPGGPRERRPRGRVGRTSSTSGWRQVLAEPDPGPPPVAACRSWSRTRSARTGLAAQRREHRRLARPARLTGAAGVAVTAATGSAWLAGLLTGAAGTAG